VFSVDQLGMRTCTEFGELVARQNGKGDVIMLFELAHLFLWPRADGQPKTIVHTAHEFKTAREAFRRLQRVIRSSSVLMAEMKSGERGIRTSHGEEGFELANGNRLLFLARSKNSGIGFTVDVLIVDEGQQTPQAAMDALLPTMSAVANTQVLFTGTVPDELNDSEYFEGVRDRGRAGSDPRTGWIEYSPPGSDDPDTADGIDIRDPANWTAANPGMGYRPGLTREVVEDEVSRLTPEAVRRLRLSVWPNRRPVEAIKNNDLDMGAWKNGVDSNGKLLGGAVIAVALGRGGGYASVAAASLYDDTSIFVEHKRTDRQTLWVAGYVQELKTELGDALVVLDPKNAGPIITDLDRLGIKYLPMNLNEVTAAFSQFIEYVNAGLVWHRDQQEVSTSLEYATPRAIGQAGFSWDASDATKPVTLAQAVTWAVWGVRKRESSPPPTPALVRGYA
jgi:phage terminase large subunit-like protein